MLHQIVLGSNSKIRSLYLSGNFILVEIISANQSETKLKKTYQICLSGKSIN